MNMAPTAHHPNTRRGALALTLSALLVGGLAACSTAGPETPVSVDDITENDTSDEEIMGDENGLYDGPYDESFGDTTSYVGEEVVLYAEVDEVMSDQAFTIGDALLVEPLLVLSEDGVMGLEEDQDVRVAGVVMERFVLVDIEAEWGVDLDDDLWLEWEGVSYVDATMVETDIEF